MQQRHAHQNDVDAKMMKLKSALLIWLTFSLSGCLQMKLENSRRLMDRPDFNDAALAAPEWVKDALKTINALEEQLEAPD